MANGPFMLLRQFLLCDGPEIEILQGTMKRKVFSSRVTF